MFGHALAFLAGNCILQGSSQLPAYGFLALVVLLPGIFFRPYSLQIIAMAAAGFLCCWGTASLLLDYRLPSELEGVEIRVEGKVLGLPEKLDHQRLRFTFEIQRFQLGEIWEPLSLPVRLSWYRNAPVLKSGERWQLSVRLKQPHGFSNPGGFDYEKWLFSHRIRATGYVRKTNTAKRLASASHVRIDRARQFLIETLNQPGTLKQAGLLTALGVGTQSGLTTKQWEVLRKTGTNHLMAISGLHIGLVAGMAFFVFRKIWCWLGAPGWWPAPRAAALPALVCALVYALLSGFQIPAQRALLMVAVWLCAIFWVGRPGPWKTWSIALIIVLLHDPLATLTAGFWLSFGAVAWILFLNKGRYNEYPTWRKMLHLQLGLSIGLTPFLWLWFGQVSLISPIANIISIPWVGFLVVPFLLLGLLCVAWLPSLAHLLILIADESLNQLWRILELLANLPDIVWHPANASTIMIPLLFAAMIALMLPRPIPVRLPALLLLITIFSKNSDHPNDGDLWITLLEVGQGLSVVLATRQHVLVYDTGPSFRSGFDTGAAVVVPYLRWSGHQQVDRLLISHSDNDHAGGGRSTFNGLHTISILAGEPEEIEWAKSQRCVRGQHWVWDHVRFELLAPQTAAHGNNASCVLRIETADGRVVLLPGDIEKPVERWLLTNAASKLRADVLVAPHHGSLTSSTASFVDAVQPSLVLFAVGYQNRYGFPKPAIVERYRKAGAQIMDTASAGAIQIKLRTGESLDIQSNRIKLQRYWNRKTSAGEGRFF